MSDQRDWDKELAKIDKAIAREPASAPPPVFGGVPGAAARIPAPSAPVVRRRERVSTWLLTLLAVALAAGLPFWPYAKGCGLPLALYAGVVAVLVLAALWAAGASWRRRQGIAHVLALLTLGWGFVLAASIVLPRIGYARTAATWICP